MGKRRGSSRRWLKEHEEDIFVKRARSEGFRSRAAYKLLELDERFKLIRRNQVAVDLGAAPGGWTQVLARRLDGGGTVIALDILEMEPIEGVTVIQGDFREDEALAELEKTVDPGAVGIVLSDMAPNISGVQAADQASSMYLAELALDFAQSHLRKGGQFVTKVFQGEGVDAYIAGLRKLFGKVSVAKPSASRPRSREIYLVCKDFKG